MNILISSASYIFSDHVPGGEFQIAHAIVKRLAERGHRVHVIAPRVQLHAPIEHVITHELGGYNFVETRNYTGYYLRWWQFQRHSRRLAKNLIRTESIEVIHHIRPAYPHKFSLCADLGVPFFFGPMSLLWSGASSEGGVPRWIPKWYSPLTDRLADRLNMVQGHRLWDETLRHAQAVPVSVPSTRTKILPESVRDRSPLIPLGVDAKVFKPGERGDHPLRVLFVGKLEKRKAVDDLLKAFSMVVESRPETELAIVGTGEEADNLKALANDLGIASQVTFFGLIPFSDMPPFYQQADLFCLPSLGEPFGIAILQAMSTGLPVVATQDGGIPEFIEDGHSGLLVPPRSPESIAEALLKLLTNDALRRELGHNNRILCETKFDWDAIVDQIEELYRSAI